MKERRRRLAVLPDGVGIEDRRRALPVSHVLELVRDLHQYVRSSAKVAGADGGTTDEKNIDLKP